MAETATRTRLAAALREIAAKASADNAAHYEALAMRADTGEFDDFSAVHVCGPTALYADLRQLGFDKFAARVANGAFDASREESDAWANSPEGRDAMAGFTPENRAALFGVFDA